MAGEAVQPSCPWILAAARLGLDQHRLDLVGPRPDVDPAVGGEPLCTLDETGQNLSSRGRIGHDVVQERGERLGVALRGELQDRHTLTDLGRGMLRTLVGISGGHGAIVRSGYAGPSIRPNTDTATRANQS